MQIFHTAFPDQLDIFWHEWELNSDSTAYNISLAYEIHGPLDEKRLTASVSRLIKSHDIFRVVFSKGDEGVKARLFEHLEPCVDQIDLSNVEDIKSAAVAEVDKIRKFVFDLEKPPLFKIGLIKMSPEHYVFALCFPHILVDGLSERYIIDYLSRCYNQLALTDYSLSFDAYFEEKNRILSVAENSASCHFWNDQIANISPEANNLNAIIPMQNNESSNGQYLYFEVDRALVKKLKRLQQSHGSSWFCLMMSAYLIVLNRLSECNQLTVSYAVNCRSKAMSQAMGCFVNALPFSIFLKEDVTFSELLDEVTQLRAQQKRHQHYPFLEIVKLLRQIQGRDIKSALNIGLMQTHVKTTALSLNGLDVTSVMELNNEVIYDLCLEYEFVEDVIKCRLNYRNDYFDPSVVSRLPDYFLSTLNAFCGVTEKSIRSFSLLSDQEQQRLLIDWNNTRTPYKYYRLLSQLIADQSRKNPKNTALIFEDQFLSYEALERRTNTIATYLNDRTAKGSSIPIIVPTGLDRIVAMLSVLKSGSAYVPIDPNYPAHRMSAILKDCQPSQLITTHHYGDKVNKALADVDLNHVSLFFIEDWEKKATSIKPLPDIKPEDLAYVLYTSGSTGMPKGVKISHRSLLNFLFAIRDLLSPNADSGFVNITPYTFDISGLEIYLPLLLGSFCVIANDRVAQNGRLLSTLIDQHSIQFVQTTPTKWQLFFDTGWNAKQKPVLLCGGETMPVSLIDKLLWAGQDVWNVYGPTETTIWSTAYQVTERNIGASSVPIGKPVANTEVYVLDKSRLPVPVGCRGELYIGGEGVASGYLNRNELTRERFIVNPLFPKQSRSYLYNTGDLATWLPDGNLMYLGRQDQQIKHHGHRIELGDIESALVGYPGIKQAAVIRKKVDLVDRYDLVAFCVLTDQNQQLTEDILRQYLLERLPAYYIPNRFNVLNKLPVNVSGKVNRRALLTVDTSVEVNENTAIHSEIGQRLAALWEEILGFQGATAESNFFAQGGDSLSAIRVAYAIEKAFSVECSGHIIFKYPDLSQLVMWIRSQSKNTPKNSINSFKKIDRIFPIPLSFAQKRFWFLSRLPFTGSYNILLAWKLKGALDLDLLVQSINEIRAHHDILRTVYKKEAGNLLQQILKYHPISVEVKRLEESQLESALDMENQSQFSLEKEPPFRVRVFYVSRNYHVLLINMHHIIFDEASINLLIRQISDNYRQLKQEQSISSSSNEVQYADYACWESTYLADEYSIDAINFWKTFLLGSNPQTLLLEHSRSFGTDCSAKHYTFNIDKQYIAPLRAICHDQNTTLFSIFLSTCYVLLNQYTGVDDLVVGVPVSLRDSEPLEQVMGCFINTLPLRCRVFDAMPLKKLLKHVKEMLLMTFQYKEVPFDQLTQYFNTDAINNMAPILPVLMTWEIASAKKALQLPQVDTERIMIFPVSSKSDLHFNFVEYADTVVCDIEYVASQHNVALIEALSLNFIELINAFSSDPNQSIFKAVANCRPIMHDGNNNKNRAQEQSRLPEIFISEHVFYDQLKSIFEKFLKTEITSFNENLFDLGMNSLLLIVIQNEIETTLNLNKKVSLIDFFKYPTITALAHFLMSSDASASASGTASPDHVDKIASKSMDIAVIGLSCQFPGASTEDQFWENIAEGKETISHFSDEELKATGVSESVMNDVRYVKSRGVIKDAHYFDANFFNMSPKEAKLTDPQQRLFIEHAWTVLESAGYCADKYSGRIGVYAGSDESKYASSILGGRPSCLDTIDDFQLHIATDRAFLTTKVSYKLNLTGPSINVNTACSTGLVAVATACQQLLEGQCDMAIAGSVSIKQPQNAGYLYQPDGIASLDGHCRPFAQDATGTVPSGGVGVVLLKRLDRAIRDNDQIHAVIKGWNINNDGSDKIGYTAPSVKQQSLCVSTALDNASVNANSLQYVEAHGTGTKLGDPIEIEALGNAFRKTTDRKQFCAIGSVKSNIGHADAAAGMAGFIKTVQSIKHRVIPASLHSDSLNESIAFDRSAFYVNKTAAPWVCENQPRRAGINCLGLGGTNAFVVLEEAPAHIKNIISESSKDSYYVLPFSAKTTSALCSILKNFQQYLLTLDKSLIVCEHSFLSDLAYTLQQGRSEFQYREVFVIETLSELEAVLENKLRGLSENRETLVQVGDPDIVFFFPGQGSQYREMGYSLYQLEPVFKNAVDHCAQHFKSYLDLDLRLVLFPKEDKNIDHEALLNQTKYTQPILFCIEYALAKLFESWGVQPTILIGHSFGEYVAAHLSGIFTLNDIIKLIVYRAELMSQVEPGQMLAVNLSSDELLPFLHEDLSIASISSPNLCVVSGKEEAILSLQENLTSKNILDERGLRILNTSHAFHSQMMKKVLPEFLEFLNGIEMRKPKIPIVSNLTGMLSNDTDLCTPEYWADHLINTVQFSKSMQTIFDTLKDPLFLTLGPSKELGSLIRPYLPDSNRQHHIHTMNSSTEYHLNKGESAKITYKALGGIWSNTEAIHWQSLNFHESAHRIALPTYPFERMPYWPEPLNKDREGLLQNFLDPNDWFYKPSWKRLDSIEMMTSKACSLNVSGGWIIFLSKNKEMNALSEYFEGYLEHVIFVSTGNKFLKKTDQHYVIDPADETHYRRLVELIKDLQFKSFNVLDFWPSDLQSQIGSIEETLNRSFYHLFNFSKCFASILSNTRLNIVSVAKEIFSVFSEEVVCPAKATVLGLCNVVPFEYPNIKVKCIDVSVNQQLASKNLISAFLFELNGLMESDNACCIAYRNGYRWVRDFVRTDLVPAHAKQVLDKEGIYLIIGGLGGIGLEIAKKLIFDGKHSVVLLSRRKLPSNDSWEVWLENHNQNDEHYSIIKNLYSMQSRGGNFHVLNADVSSISSMQKAVRFILEKIGAIRGVIHSAGQAGSGLILKKSKPMIEETLSSKLQGVHILSQLFKKVPLDFILFFSSISSIVGGIGQIDYCAANACLDSIPDAQLFHKDTFIKVFNWNKWRDVGMAVSESELKNIAMLPKDYQSLIDDNSITSEEGCEIFFKILNSYERHIVVSKMNLNDFRTNLLERSRAIFQSSSEESSRITMKEGSATLKDQFSMIIGSVLGIDTVNFSDNFFDLGGHSLLALQLLDRIEKEFNINVSIADIYKATSLSNLFDMIMMASKMHQFPSYIVPLKLEGDGTPLFIIHPVGGTVFCYMDLVDNLKYDGPVFAIQDPGLISNDYPFTSIEEMAAFYLKEIQKIAPQGPYALMGFSMGGTIAFEIARQLISNKHLVNYLGLIDSWAIFTDVNVDEFEEKMRRQLKHYKSALDKAGFVDLKSLLPCQLSRMRLLNQYRPKLIPIPINLYKAMKLMPEYSSIQDEFNYWGEYSSVGVTAYTVPGDHETVLQYPNVLVLTNFLNQHLSSDVFLEC